MSFAPLRTNPKTIPVIPIAISRGIRLDPDSVKSPSLPSEHDMSPSLCYNGILVDMLH